MAAVLLAMGQSEAARPCRACGEVGDLGAGENLASGAGAALEETSTQEAVGVTGARVGRLLRGCDRAEMGLRDPRAEKRRTRRRFAAAEGGAER